MKDETAESKLERIKAIVLRTERERTSPFVNGPSTIVAMGYYEIRALLFTTEEMMSLLKEQQL